jgi:SHQ1 protein
MINSLLWDPQHHSHHGQYPVSPPLYPPYPRHTSGLTQPPSSQPTHPLKQLKLAIFRDVLTYPLYRHLPLAEKCWKNAGKMLEKCGGCNSDEKTCCFTDFGSQGMLMDVDWSIFNWIMWEDYLIWVQGCRGTVSGVLA